MIATIEERRKLVVELEGTGKSPPQDVLQRILNLKKDNGEPMEDEDRMVRIRL